jgi:bifunctional DNase/RNase
MSVEDKTICTVENCCEQWRFAIAHIVDGRWASDELLCVTHGREVMSRHLIDDRQGEGAHYQCNNGVLFVIELIIYDYSSSVYSTAVRQVLLREAGGRKKLIFNIGEYESTCLYWALKSKDFSRPQTHATMGAIIATLGGVLQYVVINEYIKQTETLTAQVRISQNETTHIVDIRPSDAIVLAIYEKVNILVADIVLSQ